MAGKATYVNPAFTRVFEWESEEVLGKRIDYVPEEYRPETLKMIEKTRSGENFYGFETRRYTKAGKIVDVNMSATVYRDSNRVPQGSVINLKDISE